MNSTRQPEFTCQISVISSLTPLDTSLLFDEQYTDDDLSPLDQFISKTAELTQLIPLPRSPDNRLANLVLLGGVSAVESYFRSIIRRSICIDSISNKNVEKCNVSYGAAIHHTPDMLPEAFLENISFISKASIIDSIKEYLGIKGHTPNEVVNVLDEYIKVCQLRHCVVHRFGKLGSKNAIELDLESHKELLEKPLKLDFTSLQEVFFILSMTVKTINNYIFRKLLQRTACSPSIWTWDFRKDKKLFAQYYNTFATINDTTPSPILKDIYHEFREVSKPKI